MAFNISIIKILKIWFCFSLTASLFKVFGFGPVGYFIADFIFISTLFLAVVFFSIQKSELSIFNLSMILLFFVSVIFIFLPDFKNILHKLHGFRLSGLYLALPLLLMFVRKNEVYLDEWYRLFCITGFLLSLNGLRQVFYISPMEQNFLAEMGGAGRLAGDEYAVGSGAYRIFSTLPTSVHLAAYMSFVCFCIYSYRESTLKKLSFFEVMTFIMCLITLFMTYSRTSLLAFLFGLGGFLLLSSKTKLSKKLFLVLCSIVSLSLLLNYFSDSLLVMRLFTITDYSNVSAFSSRLDMWSEAINKINGNFFGYGTGIAGFHNYIADSIPTDSNYLKSLVEHGVVFGSFFIFFFISVHFYLTKKVMFASNSSESELFFCYLSFLFSTYILVSMFTNNIVEAVPVNYLWLLSISLYFKVKK